MFARILRKTCMGAISRRRFENPLATLVVGGLISSTILTLLALPALYKGFGIPKASIPVPPGSPSLAETSRGTPMKTNAS
jgi:hypothetical protein